VRQLLGDRDGLRLEHWVSGALRGEPAGAGYGHVGAGWESRDERDPPCDDQLGEVRQGFLDGHGELGDPAIGAGQTVLGVHEDRAVAGGEPRVDERAGEVAEADDDAAHRPASAAASLASWASPTAEAA
jgi:hypothetical protein